MAHLKGWSRTPIRLYICPGGRLYELASIVTISSGINIVTSSVPSPQDLRIVISGLLFSISGMVLFLISGRVSGYYSDAHDRRLLDRSRNLKQHLESIVFEETATTKIWREFFGALISAVMIAGALALVVWVVSERSVAPLSPPHTRLQESRPRRPQSPRRSGAPPPALHGLKPSSQAPKVRTGGPAEAPQPR
jgi:hypothetical protein